MFNAQKQFKIFYEDLPHQKTELTIWLSTDDLKFNLSTDIRIYKACFIIKLAAATTEM